MTNGYHSHQGIPLKHLESCLRYQLQFTRVREDFDISDVLFRDMGSCFLQSARNFGGDNGWKFGRIIFNIDNSNPCNTKTIWVRSLVWTFFLCRFLSLPYLLLFTAAKASQLLDIFLHLSFLVRIGLGGEQSLCVCSRLFFHYLCLSCSWSREGVWSTLVVALFLLLLKRFLMDSLMFVENRKDG